MIRRSREEGIGGRADPAVEKYGSRAARSVRSLPGSGGPASSCGDARLTVELEAVAERVERVALDRARPLLREVECGRNFGDLLRRAADTEMPADDLPLPRGKICDCLVDELRLHMLDGVHFRVDGRRVGDHRLEGRAVG